MANKTFSEVWGDAVALSSEYLQYFGSGVMVTLPSNFDWAVFYYLCVGRWGNTQIIVPDAQLTRWKLRFFSIVFQFGPNWAKQMDLQNKLRNLSDDELLRGSLMVSTNALNPAEKPSGTFDSLDMPKVDTIQQQATSQSRRSKMDAYATLAQLLRTDVTENFLIRFDSLFRSVLYNQFEGPEEEDDDGE